jgi:hypothetical protein
MGLAGKVRKSFICNLEAGRVKNPKLLTVIRFIRACGAKWADFCALYDPPPNPELDTREIDRASLSTADKETLKRRLRQQVYKYESRTKRWVKGRPMEPVVQERAQKRFVKHRRQYGIIEMAARRFLDKQEFPAVQYFAWLDLTQRIFSVLRRYPEAERATRLEPVRKLAERWELDPLLFERLKAVIVGQFEDLTRAPQSGSEQVC